jgi:hypothetical protein
MTPTSGARLLLDVRGRLTSAFLPAMVWSAVALLVHRRTGTGGAELLLVTAAGAALFAYPRIVVHELGHLLAAWALRVPVIAVQIGGGPVLLQFGRRTRVEICLLPPDGATIVDPAYGRSRHRRRLAHVATAGPVANALAGFACLAAAGGWDTQLAIGGFAAGHAPAQALLVVAAANLYGAVRGLTRSRRASCRHHRMALAAVPAV